MTTPDLSLLLTRTAAGDREARARFTKAWRQPVYIYVLVQCGGNRTLAEDVLQDTFLGIWESAPRYQPTGSAKAWILAIARHQALKAQRREAAFVHPEEPFWEGVPSPEETTPETARSDIRSCCGCCAPSRNGNVPSSRGMCWPGSSTGRLPPACISRSAPSFGFTGVHSAGCARWPNTQPIKRKRDHYD